jgi:hypothetical protein
VSDRNRHLPCCTRQQSLAQSYMRPALSIEATKAPHHQASLPSSLAVRCFVWSGSAVSFLDALDLLMRLGPTPLRFYIENQSGNWPRHATTRRPSACATAAATRAGWEAKLGAERTSNLGCARCTTSRCASPAAAFTAHGLVRLAWVQENCHVESAHGRQTDAKSPAYPCMMHGPRHVVVRTGQATDREFEEQARLLLADIVSFLTHAAH